MDISSNTGTHRNTGETFLTFVEPELIKKCINNLNVMPINKMPDYKNLDISDNDSLINAGSITDDIKNDKKQNLDDLIKYFLPKSSDNKEPIQNLSANISRQYEVRDQQEIEGFLLKNDQLISLLLEIPSKARQYFGISTNLALCVLSDPEEPEDVSLTVFIKSEKEVEETLSCLDKFNDEWWLAVSKNTDFLISVDTEYV